MFRVSVMILIVVITFRSVSKCEVAFVMPKLRKKSLFFGVPDFKAVPTLFGVVQISVLV